MSPSKKSSFRIFRHASLVTVETLLLFGVLKDWITGLVRTTDLPNWGKVLFVMATTVGVFGSVFLVLEKMTHGGVARAHDAMRGRVAVPTLVIHVVVLFLLFLLYARTLGLKVFV
jgi:hypothetical protein